jgi:hypothetical protein
MSNELKWIGICILIGVLVVGAKVLFFTTDYADKTVDVVVKEIQPSRIQERYEWFQSQKGAIDAADANIVGMINTAKAINGNTSEEERKKWDRTTKQLHAKTISEIMGTIANRNRVVMNYNVAKSQWNMNIADLGNWPKGVPSKEDFNQLPDRIPEYSYGNEMKGL